MRTLTIWGESAASGPPPTQDLHRMRVYTGCGSQSEPLAVAPFVVRVNFMTATANWE